MKKYLLLALLLISCTANTGALFEEVNSLDLKDYSELEKFKYNKDVFITKAEDHCLSLENGAINKGYQVEKIVIEYLCPEFEGSFFLINPIFRDVRTECLNDSVYTLWFEVDEDRWNSIYYDGSKEGDLGYVELPALECVFEQLEVPSSVIERIYNTNALMGSQDAKFGEIKAIWTYHPKNGLDMFFELLDPNI